MGGRIRAAIVGVGNCASSFVQGIRYYADNDPAGLMRDDIGGYKVSDIDVVLAFDIDRRKVGQPLSEALKAPPNCVSHAHIDPITSPVVRMGKVLDGLPPMMSDPRWLDGERFLLAADAEPSRDDVVRELRESRADVLINYLPVGSQKATEFYVECCLEAGTHLLNCIPVFIASDPAWASRFAAKGLVVVGDDMKSQFGASVLSQALEELAGARGHAVQCHIQRNIGGNTDFLNMMDPARLRCKKISKENVLRSARAGGDGFVHAGPSEYISYLKDTKVANIHMELTGFMGAPVTLDAQLTVQDSPNSAGVVADALRYLKVAAELGARGPLHGPSSFTQKTPPSSLSLDEAQRQCAALARREL